MSGIEALASGSAICVPKRVDLIVELLANINPHRDLQVLSAPGGVAVVGNRGRGEINPREMMQRGADVREVMLPAPTVRNGKARTPGCRRRSRMSPWSRSSANASRSKTRPRPTRPPWSRAT